jgi:hypothetical protein
MMAISEHIWACCIGIGCGKYNIGLRYSDFKIN